jgi:hypothetical protein
MENHYQSHLIRSGAYVNPDTNQWTPELMIFWNQSRETICKHPLFKVTFATGKESQSCALQFARRWIDDGKPELPKP